MALRNMTVLTHVITSRYSIWREGLVCSSYSKNICVRKPYGKRSPGYNLVSSSMPHVSRYRSP